VRSSQPKKTRTTQNNAVTERRHRGTTDQQGGNYHRAQPEAPPARAGLAPALQLHPNAALLKRIDFERSGRAKQIRQAAIAVVQALLVVD
jgi:hypothetical protein